MGGFVFHPGGLLVGLHWNRSHLNLEVELFFHACRYANGCLAIAQGFHFSVNYSFLTVSPLLAGIKQALPDQRNFPVIQLTDVY